MEIPDIIVVNKKDHPAADVTIHEVRSILALSGRTSGWEPPVLATNAVSGEGVEELWDSIVEHREHLVTHCLLDQRRGESLEREVIELTMHEVGRLLAGRADSDPALLDILRRVTERTLDPMSAVGSILREVLGFAPGPR
jgi:LAO/AO transport system kinase